LVDLPKGTNIEKLTKDGVKLSDFIDQARAAEAEGRIDKSLRVLKIEYDRLHPTSVKKDIGVLSAVFGMAESEDWIASNPCHKVTVSGYFKSRRAQRVRFNVLVVGANRLLHTHYISCVVHRAFSELARSPIHHALKT
jgi:hypothetical protein